MQFKQKYILLAVKSGLMVVHQQRAHERILYEVYLERMQNREAFAQQELYASRIELDPADHDLLIEIFDDICSLGFDIRKTGENTIEVLGIPADMEITDPEEWIREILEEYKEREADVKEESGKKVAAAMARSCSISSGDNLKPEEMREILDQLFACSEPSLAPDGKAIFRILQISDIEKLFN